MKQKGLRFRHCSNPISPKLSQNKHTWSRLYYYGPLAYAHCFILPEFLKILSSLYAEAYLPTWIALYLVPGSSRKHAKKLWNIIALLRLDKIIFLDIFSLFFILFLFSQYWIRFNSIRVNLGQLSSITCLRIQFHKYFFPSERKCWHLVLFNIFFLKLKDLSKHFWCIVLMSRKN